MNLYDAIQQVPGGRAQLAKSRLRYRVLSVLHEALEKSGMNQNDLAASVNVSKSAVSQALTGNGNLRPDTVAAYLDAMGYELRLELDPANTARAEATDWVSGPVLCVAMPRTAVTSKAGRFFELSVDSTVDADLKWSTPLEISFEDATAPALAGARAR